MLSPACYIYQTQLEKLAEVSDEYRSENIKFYICTKLINGADEEIAEMRLIFSLESKSSV